jgi:DNA-binding response OmpR family regulator
VSEKQIKVLFVDDNVELLESTAAGLGIEGFHVEMAANGKTGLEKINNGNPDLVLLDVKLPDSNGFDICRDIRKNPLTAGIPIIMVTGDRTVDIDKGFAVGADDCIIKPIDIPFLAQRITKLVRRNDKILVVEDDRQVSDVIAGIMTKYGCEVEVLTNGVNIVEKVRNYGPGLVLLDITLAIPPDGIEICRMLKSDPATKDISVLMLTANECTNSIDSCFQLGAEDYIFKPFNIPDLLGKIKKHLASARKKQYNKP